MFNSILISTYSVEGFILRDEIHLIGPQLKTNGICYYAIVLKEKKETQKLTTQKKVFENAHCPTNNTSVTNIIRRYVISEIPEIGWDLSLMKINYNLTKRTTKTDLFEKYLKMYIINIKTILTDNSLAFNGSQ